MHRFSANLGFLWSDLELPGRIAAAAQAGFRAVELHWPYGTPPGVVRRACTEAGVKLLAMNTPLGDTASGEFGQAALPERQSEFREGFLQAADYARTAGASRLHVMAGVVPNNARTRAVLGENLLWAEAQAPELWLLLEPLNNFDKPGYFYHLPAQAAAIIDSVPLKRTQVMFDAYHVGREGHDPVCEYDRFAAQIGHVQIAAVPNRHEPYGGQLDLRAFLVHLSQRGYKGWVGCEYVPERTADSGMARLRKLAEALV